METERSRHPDPRPGGRFSPVPVGAAELRARFAAVAGALSRPRAEPGALVTAPLAAFALGALLLSAASFLSGFDAWVAQAMRDEPEGVRAFLRILTDVGLIAWYFYPALLLTLVLLLTGSTWRHRAVSPPPLFVMSAWFAASLGTASAITHAIKYALGRARPELLDSHGIASFDFLRLGSAYESFPSGHSTNMGVVAVALAIWFPGMRWPILLLGACLAMTRIVVERHYLSDVFAGFAIGVTTALVLARFLALRAVAYRVDAGGRGWTGLLPRRRTTPA